MEWWNKIKAKITGKSQEPERQLITTVATSYEVSLVPEVKIQAIKALKLRNLVLYICIMVSVISVGAVVILFGVKSGQDIAMATQDSKLTTLSAKLMGYDELGDLVTVQTQLEKLSEIANNKTVLSRVFGAMDVMLPQGGDVVQLSDLRVDLYENVIRMEAQADAKVAPLIDYRVLESFKKGVALTKYDYGRFVDANGAELPTWCVSEADENGNAYRNGESYFAWWNVQAEGCQAVAKSASADMDDNFVYSDNAEVEKNEEDQVTRVKIWRTPQFTAWFNAGLMDLGGKIQGIEHFASACTTYAGTTQPSGTPHWTSTNNCMLAPEGLTVSSSSNGRDSSDNLVLRFTASAAVNPEFFAFRNKHMIAIGPMGQNVTDSYVQIGGMFTQAARECDVNDSECLSNATNTGGSE